MNQREKFYFEIYCLIDKEGNLTKLGKFYAYAFTHHYIKALRLYLTFSEELKEKNKIFKNNPKAMEYLVFFKYHFTEERPSKVIKR